MDTLADLGSFLGRLHLVLLHLPIGFIGSLVLIEVAARRPRWREARSATGLVLAASIAVTWLTAALGWLLAEAGGYEGGLLDWHRWTGVGVAVLTVLLGLAHLAKQHRGYQILLAATLTLTVIAGHLGGSLTHGPGFLTEHAPWRWEAPGADVARPGGFGEAARVLQDYCVSCHGAEKTKGGLRLDSAEAILAGGDSGPAIAPGDPEVSLLLQRMLLPLEHDDHMPPQGKPQPMPDEVLRVKTWIGAGAMD